MIPLRMLAAAGLALGASACSINVHDDYRDYREACEVKCADGSRAEVSCTKPKIPACSCEPSPTAACVKQRSGDGGAV